MGPTTRKLVIRSLDTANGRVVGCVRERQRAADSVTGEERLHPPLRDHARASESLHSIESHSPKDGTVANLVPKLPAPAEDDLAAGILENIDLDSYRAEKQTAMKIVLDDEDGSLDPVSAAGGGHKGEPDLERLSEILKSFNDHFGNIDWEDAYRIQRRITEEIPRIVAEDEAYRDTQANDDPVNARVEMNRALSKVMLDLIADEPQLFKAFQDNESFKRWLEEAVFKATYQKKTA